MADQKGARHLRETAAVRVLPFLALLIITHGGCCNIPFKDVVVIGVENMLGYTKTNPARRVVLRTQKEVIPLSVMYIPHTTAEYNRLSDQIQGFIGPK